MKISVTKTDIEKGKPKDANWCPVALAIKRQIGRNITVHHGFILNASGKLIDLPGRAQDFISRFDGKLSVQPFRFNLKLKVN